MKKKYKILLSLFLTTVLILAFTPHLNPPAGGWYQQFIPNIGGRHILDMSFTDSLNGYAVTNEISDTSFILRTTNGGDNWFFSLYSHYDNGMASYYNIQFINHNTGFVSGWVYEGSLFKIVKTTNAGLNWFNINAPYGIIAFGMFVLSADTIWLADQGYITGGVFRTTNGGVNWTLQYQSQGNNPRKIYMYDRNLGFITPPTFGQLYRTTNGGGNWTQVPGEDGFYDMYFVDSQTGWKTHGTMKKTTNGGLNWVQQTLPSGGIIVDNAVDYISVVNKDTVWGVGGNVYYSQGQFRGILFRTINGGINWSFQVPDTAFHLDFYDHIVFLNKNTGWAYRSLEGGIHTTTGGDPVWLTGIQQISSEIPKQFKLYQNYPNPFNPRTIISYELRATSFVEMSVYDITGRHIMDLVNQKQNAGTYEVDFSGNGLSSGVYFYRITITSGKGVFTDTKKMILIK